MTARRPAGLVPGFPSYVSSQVVSRTSCSGVQRRQRLDDLSAVPVEVVEAACPVAPELFAPSGPAGGPERHARQQRHGVLRPSLVRTELPGLAVSVEEVRPEPPHGLVGVLERFVVAHGAEAAAAFHPSVDQPVLALAVAFRGHHRAAEHPASGENSLFGSSTGNFTNPVTCVSRRLIGVSISSGPVAACGRAVCRRSVAPPHGRARPRRGGAEPHGEGGGLRVPCGVRLRPPGRTSWRLFATPTRFLATWIGKPASSLIVLPGPVGPPARGCRTPSRSTIGPVPRSLSWQSAPGPGAARAKARSLSLTISCRHGSAGRYPVRSTETFRCRPRRSPVRSTGPPGPAAYPTVSSR